MSRLIQGDVLTYPYRWAWERDKGRSPDGAKERPVCIAISIADDRGGQVLFLVAISSKPPQPGQIALDMPEIERRRAGLHRHASAWIYINEVNVDRLEASYYLDPEARIGSISPGFLKLVAAAIKTHLSAGGVVKRSD